MFKDAGRALIVAGLAFAFASSALADEGGDVTKGEKVFKKCQSCHAVGPGATNRVGPVLNGIVGKPADAVGALLVNPQEGLLENIVGPLPVPQHPQRIRVDAATVAGVEFGKSVLLATAQQCKKFFVGMVCVRRQQSRTIIRPLMLAVQHRSIGEVTGRSCARPP